MCDPIKFQNALQSGDLSSLRRIPKSDLHLHSILGTRIENIERWLGRALERPPKRMSSLNDMVSYSQGTLYQFTMNRSGFEFTAESAIRDAITDGVTLLEMSMDVRFISMYDAIPDGFLSFVSGLVDRYKGQIDFRPEIGMSKDRPAAQQIELASMCIESGLFRSIDLYGNETALPPEPFCELYANARKRGLKLKAHVGEFVGAELIGRTLDVLKIDEIQHGIKAATSKPLMKRLRQENIRLNVCPSSNVALGVVDSISHHPIRTLLDNGVRVTINTDDLTIFGQSVSQEFLLLYNSGVLAAQELDFVRQEGLRT